MRHRRPNEGFEVFWLDYLARHGDRTCRRWHDAGLGAAIVLIALACTIHAWWLVGAAVAVSYAAAWYGHLAVSHNRPATFDHPLWSLRANVRWLRLRAFAPRV